MKIFLFLVFALASTISLRAQIGHGLTKGASVLGMGKYAQSKEKESTKSMFYDLRKSKNQYYQQNDIVAKDSAYYAAIVKKHGWWIGIGKKLTKKEASHLSCYYKLTKKNKAGNWTFIEAFDGYGNPTTYHNIGTYLANQYDDEDKGLNKDWREKLQSVCKWEIVADASGKEVVQERALDADGDVIYIYSPVKIGEREYTGSFTDSWGMPIFMRSDSLGNDAGYANFVHITQDERGFEVLCSFTDRYGYPQKNKDGAYMTRREYDDMGNQIREASLNIVGNNMIDDYGNCGWENTYKNNHRISSIYYNADWEPMLFPNLRNEGYKVYGFRFEPDEFGRDTAMVIIDAKGNPDVDREYGIHKIVNRYNNHGQQIYQAYYDINGNLIAGNKLGIAQVVYDFTPKGLLKTIEYKGQNGQYVVDGNGYCKKVFAYDKEGVEISEIEYITNNDRELIKSFEYSRDAVGNTVRTWYQKNKQRVDSVDAKGRNILLAWYDLDGNPIENEGLHKDIMEFDDDNNVETETWLDKDGDPYIDDDREYSKDVTIRDNKNNTRTIYQYWYSDLLKTAYQQQFDPKTKTPTKQWDITSYGEHARVGWYDNLHYTCDVDYNMYGGIRTMVGRNEFDEPAYLTFLGTSGEVYHFSVPGKDHRRYYDEFGVEIPDSMMAEFKSNLPKAFCIEVTDTAIAYPLGLRNGDVIIAYGDWRTENDLNTNVDYFYLEAILKAKQDKQITLLRHHPETNSSEILQKNLPKGRTSDLGFYPHKIYYTQKEKQRFLNTCGKYGKEYIPLATVEDTTILLAVQTKGGFSSTKLYHLPMYNVKDPGIVLYAKEKWNKGVDTWSMLEAIEKWKKQHMFRIKGASLYITQDIETTRHIDKQSHGLGGMTFIPLKVSKELYDAVLRCYQSLGDSITNERKLISTPNPLLKIKEKQLFGDWQSTILIDDIPIPVTLTFSKDRKVNFRANATLNPDNMQIGLTINSIGGTWTLQNGCISFDFTEAVNDCDISSFDMPGMDEEQKKAMEVLLRGYLENEKANLIEKFNLSSIFNSDTFVVERINSKEMEILDGDTKRIFKKTE